MRKAPLAAAVLAGALAIPTALAAGAKTTVGVKLSEFKVVPSPKSAAAGTVVFKVRNTGSIDHELDVVRTNLPVGKLPVKGAKVSLKPLGRISPLKPGASKTLRLTLKAGRYVLYCNVAGHYQAGQRVAFTVK